MDDGAACGRQNTKVLHCPQRSNCQGHNTLEPSHKILRYFFTCPDTLSTGYQCYDGSFIPLHAYCDGQRDCAGKNWEDEPESCGKLSFRVVHIEKRGHEYLQNMETNDVRRVGTRFTIHNQYCLV